METSPEVDPAALPPGTRVGPWRVLSRRSRGDIRGDNVLGREKDATAILIDLMGWTENDA
jgi:hypothetical protein